jgi:lipoyl-dependent peroxiredoxin
MSQVHTESASRRGPASPTQGDPGPVVRRGRVSWLTHPPHGTARIESDSAAFHALPVVLPEDSPGAEEATPGQLLALTHSMFLAAALSERLMQGGVPANELVVEATCTFGGPISARELTALDLNACGRVPGLDEQGFRAAAEEARRQALRAAGVREELTGKLTSELYPASSP